MTDTPTTAAALGTTPVWSWSLKGRSAKVLGTVALVGAVMMAVGLFLMVTTDKESIAAGGGFFAATCGLIVALVAWGLWFGREALVLRSDGVLEHWKRRQRTQELRVDVEAVTLVRSSVRKRIRTANGHSGTKTIHFLSVVPSSELGRLQRGQRPPDHWLSLTTFPASKDDELRQALEQFTSVQVSD